MKKLFLLLGLCLMAFTTFGTRIVVIEVNKNGPSGWQNLFNCYNRVSTTFQGCEDNTIYVTLDCSGAGYNWCRASRQIGSPDCSNYSHLIQNQGIIDAVNVLIENSEHVCESGKTRGSATQKVAVVNQGRTELYFVKATWNYNRRDATQGTLTITIETDDSNMLRRNKM